MAGCVPDAPRRRRLTLFEMREVSAIGIVTVTTAGVLFATTFGKAAARPMETAVVAWTGGAGLA